ncbi:MAG: D-alanine--D-alanine ligase [Anaerolineales bacterium]|nr:D-alanine--D-alanine ligase [Anaerolineales bacterium]
MENKLHVAVLFGGRSGEHEVSLMSARSVLSVLDPARYDVTQIGITREGKWLTGEDVLGEFERGEIDGLEYFDIQPDASRNADQNNIDVYFPVLHGTFGEDGTIQGLFELADVAYVGAGVLGSSVGMDKGVFKDVMIANDIPVVDTLVVTRSEIEKSMLAIIEKAEALSGYPLFTKPANLGSSVGVTKCNNRSDLQEGLMEAASFDRRVLIQKGIKNAREVEVSVLGNEDPKASVPGEILPSREFYSYESKYIDGTSGLVIPAELPEETKELLREYAVRAYKAIDCAGMARVDFFVENDTNKIHLNELNTIPGFTKISMYPKLWEASGLPYNKLVDRLIELAMERKAERDHTSHTFRSRA